MRFLFIVFMLITSNVLGAYVGDLTGNADTATTAASGDSATAFFPSGTLENARLDSDLQIYAGITPSANVQSLLGAASYAAIRTLLDLEAGTDFYSVSGADAAFLADIVEDTTPQLGGSLDVNGQSIVSVSSGNIVLNPDGTGTIRFPDLTNCDTIDTDADGDLACGTDSSGSGGTANILDLGNDASNESTDLVTIATTGDTNSIFSEPSADKLLITLSNDWPKSDLADALAANGSNCSAGSAPLGVDASGAVESCTDYEEDLSNSAGLAAAISDETGTGVAVFSTTPTLTTPVLGVATATSINKVAVTAPATSATLTIADGATLTASATATVSGTNTGDQTTVSGNAGTATALAANGGNCSAGSYPLGVDASGAVESCTDATTEIDSALAAFTGSTNLVTIGADAVDVLTEIAQGIKTAANDTSKLVVGTAGATDDCAKWDASGNLVTAGAACGTASGAPTDVDYLVGTANGSLSAEIVVGTSPGGELGGTWGTPTIDDTGITLTSITIGSLLGVDSIDATGAVDMDYGSVDITDHTFVTDGTGTAEIVLPAGSIDSTEILDGTIVVADTAITAGRSLTWSTNDLVADVELYTESMTWRYPASPVDTDDDKSIWCNDTANDFTVTKLKCESDQTVTMILQVDDGTPADMDSVDLVCISTPDTDTSLDGDNVVAAGECVDVATTSVSGTPTWASVTFTGTWND